METIDLEPSNGDAVMHNRRKRYVEKSSTGRGKRRRASYIKLLETTTSGVEFEACRSPRQERCSITM